MGLTLALTMGLLQIVLQVEWRRNRYNLRAKSFAQRVASAFSMPAFAPAVA